MLDGDGGGWRAPLPQGISGKQHRERCSPPLAVPSTGGGCFAPNVRSSSPNGIETALCGCPLYTGCLHATTRDCPYAECSQEDICSRERGVKLWIDAPSLLRYNTHLSARPGANPT
jgi:hypothetical protein